MRHRRARPSRCGCRSPPTSRASAAPPSTLGLPSPGERDSTSYPGCALSRSVSFPYPHVRVSKSDASRDKFDPTAPRWAQPSSSAAVSTASDSSLSRCGVLLEGGLGPVPPTPRGACRRRLGRVVRAAEVLHVDELGARRHEGLGRLALAKAVRHEALLADARRQPREVAVAGHQAEPVHRAAVEQVHRVDDQRAIGGVLAGRVAELLDGLHRVRQQLRLPLGQLRRRPVAVGAAHARRAVLRDLHQQALKMLGARVVGVDQDCEPGLVRGFCHGSTVPPLGAGVGVGALLAAGCGPSCPGREEVDRFPYLSPCLNSRFLNPLSGKRARASRGAPRRQLIHRLQPWGADCPVCPIWSWS